MANMDTIILKLRSGDVKMIIDALVDKAETTQVPNNAFLNHQVQAHHRNLAEAIWDQVGAQGKRAVVSEV